MEKDCQLGAPELKVKRRHLRDRLELGCDKLDLRASDCAKSFPDITALDIPEKCGIGFHGKLIGENRRILV